MPLTPLMPLMAEAPSLPPFPFPPPIGPTIGPLETSIFPPIVSPGGLIPSPLVLPGLGLGLRLDPKSLSIGPPLSMLSCPAEGKKGAYFSQFYVG